jgi:hypothetical protein
VQELAPNSELPFHVPHGTTNREYPSAETTDYLWGRRLDTTKEPYLT